MRLEDLHNGTALTETLQLWIGIRCLPPGAREERELGWFGFPVLSELSRDGKKILFYEVGDAGGPNYTVFLRDTDGSPPARLGEGIAEALSPDAKWVITKPAKGGPLSLIPAGAGQSRQLTHDAIDYSGVSWLPNGKQLLASGIEAGHGARDYLIDLSSGDSKPITPEGVHGEKVSPDGKSVAVVGPDGKLGVWPFDGGGIHPIPGLDTKYDVIGWSPDGGSVYVAARSENAAKVYAVNVVTGKMDLWKTLGAGMDGRFTSAQTPLLSGDGTTYAYRYRRASSQAYLVTGLK
jgi:Tol biopolymer transport system component